MCRSLSPDLILMDVRMPNVDGLEATRAIKAERPETAVLVVTAHAGEDYLLEAVRAGAAGYILKDAPRHELLGAVRRALTGESPIDQDLAMRLLRRLVEEQRPGNQPSPGAAGQHALPSSLSARELDVLLQLCAGKTNRQIARELHLSLSTVKTYLGRVLSKLEVSDRTQAAVKAVQLGLLPERGKG